MSRHILETESLHEAARQTLKRPRYPAQTSPSGFGESPISLAWGATN